MVRRGFAILCVLLLGLGLGLGLSGCSKCGWFWDEGPRACHSDPPINH